MSADFEIETRTIKVGKTGSFTVRGVNSEDVVFLTSVYLEEIKEIVARHGKNKSPTKNAVVELVMEIAQTFPLLSAEIISRCADAKGQVEKFRGLTFVKTLEALKHILELSTDDGPDLKKAGAGLLSLLEANGLQVGPLTTLLQNTMNGSANQSPS